MTRLKRFAVIATLMTLPGYVGVIVAQDPPVIEAAPAATIDDAGDPSAAANLQATSPVAAVVDNVAGPDSRWPYYQEISLPSEPSGEPYFDFIVPPAVFDQARTSDFGDSGTELADLRLLDADEQVVPYALRLRTPVNTTETVTTTEFNRTTTTEGASELTVTR